jgi:hypothetical protein
MDTQFLTIFGLSFITGVVLKRKFPTHIDIVPKIVNQMAWLFLAVLAAETFSTHKPSPEYFASGVIFLLFVTGIAFLFRGFQYSDSSDYLAIASGTFGGGNRGYALITIISTWQIFSKPQRDDIIAAFLQIDVMVLAWLMFAVPTLLWYKDKNSQVNFVDSIKNFAKDVGATPLVVMGIILLSWVFPDIVKSNIAKILGPSHPARSALLLYLSLNYVFVVTTLSDSSCSFATVVKAVFLFYLPRWIAAATILFIVVVGFGKSVWDAIFYYPVVLPVLVFAVCPPSNGLNNFMESFRAPMDRIAEISNLNIITTMVFAAILLIATFIGPSMASIWPANHSTGFAREAQIR